MRPIIPTGWNMRSTGGRPAEHSETVAPVEPPRRRWNALEHCLRNVSDSNRVSDALTESLRRLRGWNLARHPR